jgi:hypothetical protein
MRSARDRNALAAAFKMAGHCEEGVSRALAELERQGLAECEGEFRSSTEFGRQECRPRHATRPTSIVNYRPQRLAVARRLGMK